MQRQSAKALGARESVRGNARQRDTGSARGAALAREIVAWLRRRNLQVGDHVPEAPLSAAFRVSRTPVRAAMGLLVEAGVLAKRANKGFFLASDPAGAAFSAAPADELLRDTILRDRLDRRLERELTATKLMRRYAVSRRAAQSVLERLGREGILARSHGPRWHFLASLDSPQALDQSYRFRSVVEPAALLEPGFALDVAEAKRMRDVMASELARASTGDQPSSSASRMIEIDIAFHDLIGSASGNPYLASAIRQQGQLRRLALSAHRIPSQRQKESLKEHLSILDAALSGRVERAARLMRKHLLASRMARPFFANRGAPALALGIAAEIARQQQP